MFRGSKIFSERDLSTVLQNNLLKLSRETESNPNILNLNEEDYIKNLIAKYKINSIELKVDRLTVESKEEMIPSEYFPSGLFVESSQEYPKQVLTFHLPFKGDTDLLHCVPSTRILRTEEAEIIDNEICFKVINFNDNTEAIKQQRDKILNFITNQNLNVSKEVENYNSKLPEFTRESFNKAKEKFKKQSDIIKELGTPIKDSEKRD